MFFQGTTPKFEMGITATGDGAGGGVFYMNPNVNTGSANAALVIQPDGDVGVGTTNPQAKLDVDAGGVRTKQLGQIKARQYGTGSAVSVPSLWTADYLAAHIGETFFWSDNGPDLQDTTYCHIGTHADHRFYDGEGTWKGMYIAIIESSTRVNLQWSGWQLYVDNSSGVNQAWGQGTVNATLSLEGGILRVQHMNGFVVGNTSLTFGCY
jgi:hypothetical protein